tara:strand:+ start:133 stop:2220 length:2088 start_codon:yes stop_codon:yes gene_type:complete
MYKYFFLILFIQPIKLSASDFGTTGLIDIPSARMLDDGALSLTYSNQKIANISNITYQLTPWLQTTFRYTIFNPDNKDRNSSDIDGLNDRSYAAKIIILNEDKYRPSIAIGAKDILGTGVWGSEYIVASKKINNFDFTLGMGWGRLSEDNSIKNPLININKSMSNRYSSERPVGGRFGGESRHKSFFRGEKVGIFGGLEYAIPGADINLLIEYNSDSYLREIEFGTITKSSPLSYGVEWKDFYGFDLRLTHQQGNQFGFAFSTLIDTKTIHPKRIIDPFYSSYDGYKLSAAPKSLNLDIWYDRLLFDFESSGLFLRSAKLLPKKRQAIIEFSNFQFNLTADAISQALNLAQIHIPSNINNITLVLNENGYIAANIDYRRSNLDNNFMRNKFNLIEITAPGKISNPSNITKILTPNTNVKFDLAARFQLFDPDLPFKHQLYLKIDTSTSISQNWSLSGSFAINIDNNFDLTRAGSSALEPVRTDINQYLVKGSSGIESLYFERYSSLNNEIYYRLYAGILEQMYSGIGIEFLYYPFMSRFAFGSTIYKVRKRGFERDFEMLDYETTSGFVSIFYASPFYNFDIAIHHGKYLAGDKGRTIEIRRTFDNGFSVGAFVTNTDVSAAEYGEGSFDKGLYFKIPFETFSLRHTKSSFSTVLRSIQRDGGQKLDDYTGRLWHDLRNVRYDSLNNNKDRMLPR